VPAEGAAFVVLEERERAVARQAPIYGEVIGFAMGSDPCHPAALPASGRALYGAMRRALADGDCRPEDVSFVMADAMGSEEGDLQEAAAITELFGSGAVAVSAPKAMFGHSYGAAGAMDVSLAALALDGGVVPATPNCTRPDARCRLDMVTAPRAGALAHAMINGRGSGGINAALLLAGKGAQ
jgi:3-oxoacyl-(acyl-carrier-protein) synthase